MTGRFEGKSILVTGGAGGNGALFLASEDASFMVGCAAPVDGGLTANRASRACRSAA